jgi:hypothetical protein
MKDFGRLLTGHAAGITQRPCDRGADNAGGLARAKLQSAPYLPDLRQGIDKRLGSSVHPVDSQICVTGEQRQAGRIHEGFGDRKTRLVSCHAGHQSRDLPKMRQQQVEEAQVLLGHVAPVAGVAMKDQRRVFSRHGLAAEPETGAEAAACKTAPERLPVACRQRNAAQVAFDLVLSARFGIAAKPRVER